MFARSFVSGMSNLAGQIAAVVEEILWVLGALTAVGLAGLAVVVAIVIVAVRSHRTESGAPVPSG